VRRLSLIATPTAWEATGDSFSRCKKPLAIAHHQKLRSVDVVAGCTALWSARTLRFEKLFGAARRPLANHRNIIHIRRRRRRGWLRLLLQLLVVIGGACDQ